MLHNEHERQVNTRLLFSNHWAKIDLRWLVGWLASSLTSSLTDWLAAQPPGWPAGERADRPTGQG